MSKGSTTLAVIAAFALLTAGIGLSYVGIEDLRYDTEKKINVITRYIDNTGNERVGLSRFLPVQMNSSDTFADEECLTYESSDGLFEWQTCGSGGGGGSSAFTYGTGYIYNSTTTDQILLGGTATATTAKLEVHGDIGGDYFTASSTSVASTFAGGYISQASSTNTGSSTILGVLTASGGVFGNLTGNVTGDLTGSVTGNADTATALAANGDNCSAGQAPLGVDASGAVESCFDVWTEAENTSAAYIANITGSPLDELSNVAALTEAEGDILYYLNGEWNTLASSTDGLVLELNNGYPSWQTDDSGSGAVFAWTDTTLGVSTSTLLELQAGTIITGSSTISGTTTLVGDSGTDLTGVAYDAWIHSGDATSSVLKLGSNTIMGTLNQTIGSIDWSDTGYIKTLTTPSSETQFVFLDPSNEVRFALAEAGNDKGTYNPRSMIIAGPFADDANYIKCSYWGFWDIDCITAATGADLGVQDDIQALGNITIGGTITASSTITFEDTGTSTAAGNFDFAGDVEADQFIASGATSTFDGIVTTTIVGCTEALETDASGNIICGSDATGSGADFAWTPTGYGVSTSTTLGFLNGFLSTASSTIDGTLTLSSTTEPRITFENEARQTPNQELDINYIIGTNDLGGIASSTALVITQQHSTTSANKDALLGLFSAPYMSTGELHRGHIFLGYGAGQQAYESGTWDVVQQPIGGTATTTLDYWPVTCIGARACENMDWDPNNVIGTGNPFGVVAIGERAMSQLKDSGIESIAIGSYAMGAATVASSDIAIGLNVMPNKSGGKSNTIIGAEAGGAFTDGNSNTCVGAGCLDSLQSGDGNVAMGDNAMLQAGEYEGATDYADFNVGIGAQAFRDVTEIDFTVGIGADVGRFLGTSTNNVFIGHEAAEGDCPASASCETHVLNSLAIGFQAGHDIATSSDNLFIGYRAGDLVTSGSGNMLIGYDLDTPAVTTNDYLSIANLLISTNISTSSSGTTVSDADLGIGTSTPFNRLTVGGDMFVDGNLTATGTITFTNLAQAGTECVQVSNTGVLSASGAGCGGGSGLWTDGGDATYLTSTTDSLLIGTTSPAVAANYASTLTVHASSSDADQLIQLITSNGDLAHRITNFGVPLWFSNFGGEFDWQSLPSLSSATLADNQFQIIRANNTAAAGPAVVGYRARGSDSSLAVPQADDELLQFSGRGYDGAWDTQASANITMYAAETWDGTGHGTYIAFETTPIDSTTEAERLRIADDGIVTINQGFVSQASSTVDGALTVTGSLNAVSAIDATTETTFEAAIDSLSNLTVTGALNSGSITSGFGNIDIGSSNLDADGTVNLGGTVTISASGELIIPVGASPTVATDGEIAIDTTSGQLKWDGGSAVHIITGTTSPAFNIASTTLDGEGNSFSAATSSFLLKNDPEAFTLIGVYCTATSSGDALINFHDGAGNQTESATCDGGTATYFSTNNTWTAFEDFIVDASSTAGVVDRITATAIISKTAD